MTKDTERALKLFIVLSRASKVILEEAHKPSENMDLIRLNLLSLNYFIIREDNQFRKSVKRFYCEAAR